MLYFATSAQQGMLCKLAGPINRRQDLREPGSWAMFLDVLESTQSFLAQVLL